MADKTGIEWTDATWNPIRGCSLVSDGCRNCYAMHVAARFDGPDLPYEGLTMKTSQGPKWTGEIMYVPEALHIPGRWKKPRKIFVNSMSDLFHPNVEESFIDAVFAVMAQNPHHVFQVLTKRPERMRAYLRDSMRLEKIYLQWHGTSGQPREAEAWPLPNVWLGVSVEDQNSADTRIPVLLETPAAVRWLSMEPLLEEVTVFSLDGPIDVPDGAKSPIDWVVVGGESGRNARPLHPIWAKSLRDQCEMVGVPYLFKQWGEWLPIDQREGDWFAPLYKPNRVAKANEDQAVLSEVYGEKCTVETAVLHKDGSVLAVTVPMAFQADTGAVLAFRIGKKAAGRALDGVQHDGYPQTEKINA